MLVIPPPPSFLPPPPTRPYHSSLCLVSSFMLPLNTRLRPALPLHLGCTGSPAWSDMRGGLLVCLCNATQKLQTGATHLSDKRQKQKENRLSERPESFSLKEYRRPRCASTLSLLARSLTSSCLLALILPRILLSLSIERRQEGNGSNLFPSLRRRRETK